MDLFTHIVLGAAVGGLTGAKKIGNKAFLWGAICGVIPDIDTIILPFVSSTQGLFIHLGFSHSIFLFIVLSPILGLLFRKCNTSLDYSIAQWTSFVFVNLLSHSFLDSLTVYGTGLFEPFFDKRFALSSIAYVDLFFTIPLFVIVAFALRIKQFRYKALVAWLGIFISIIYLSFTFLNKLYIQSVFEKKLHAQEIRYSKTEIFPIIGSNFLWNCVAQDRDGFWMCYESNLSRHSFDLELYMRNDYYIFDFEEDTRIKDLQEYTKGYYVIQKYDNGDVIFNDLRYGRFGFNAHASFMESFTIRNTEGTINFIEKNRQSYITLILRKFGLE